MLKTLVVINGYSTPRLPMHHPIASNHAWFNQQFRKFDDASSVPHPK
jgi:hypothetical protein